MTEFDRVTTDQLTVGDVVHEHGMRLVIDQPLIYTHAGAYVTDAQISNWDDLVAEANRKRAEGITNSSAAFIVGQVVNKNLGEPRWTIQGNTMASWYRETR